MASVIPRTQREIPITLYIGQHFLYFTSDTLTRSLRLAGFEVAQLLREGTDLRRLTLTPLMRLALESLFVIARVAGL